MTDILQVADQYYVLATSVLADHESRVLKQGETFAIFDPYGDVQPITHAESGIFHHGTRHVSALEFMLHHQQRPLLLNSTLRDDNGVLKVDMTNPDFTLNGTGFVTKGTLYVNREKFLLDSKCLERIEISNFGARDIEVEAGYRVQADFKDIFEIRGSKRVKRGASEETTREKNTLTFKYMGLDNVRRVTAFELKGVEFTLQPDGFATFKLRIPARGKIQLSAELSFSEEVAKTTSGMISADYDQGLKRIQADHAAGRAKYCTVRSSNEQFDSWIRRSTDDLVMMTTLTEEGFLYPYAGIPWFCTAFGRDGIITAMQCLWANPSLSKGVLNFLAKTQAQERVPEQDATPGKIVHEVRDGEMAALKEIPFGRYYGSVDSTPLFICLGGAYFSRTNDLETISKLWPAFEKALLWIDRFGDADGDGFVEYARESANGLVQQGWKDSSESVFHEDGSDAKGPIALCEVQGYCYMARIEGAKMADAVGRGDFAQDLRKKAANLRDKFDAMYWQDDLGTYALALDGTKKPCRVKTSNAGQCLFTGIVKPERAARLVETLMKPESFSGWGVRTLTTDSIRFNPMSYHNGSVWPHDVSLIAWGMAKYGFTHEAEKLFNGMFKAATYMELMRMPEVFCGFERREGEAPTLYPHACSPQAWAAGSVYMLLQGMLGVVIDATIKQATFKFPRLPDSVESMKISALSVDFHAPEDPGKVDLMVQNYHSDVSVQLAKRSTGIRVTVEK